MKLYNAAHSDNSIFEPSTLVSDNHPSDSDLAQLVANATGPICLNGEVGSRWSGSMDPAEDDATYNEIARQLDAIHAAAHPYLARVGVFGLPRTVKPDAGGRFLDKQEWNRGYGWEYLYSDADGYDRYGIANRVTMACPSLYQTVGMSNDYWRRLAESAVEYSRRSSQFEIAPFVSPVYTNPGHPQQTFEPMTQDHVQWQLSVLECLDVDAVWVWMPYYFRSTQPELVELYA